MVWKECGEGLTWLKARRFLPDLEGFFSLLEFEAVLCIVQGYNLLRTRVLSSDIQSASEQMLSNGWRSVLFVPTIGTYLFCNRSIFLIHPRFMSADEKLDL